MKILETSKFFPYTWIPNHPLKVGLSSKREFDKEKLIFITSELIFNITLMEHCLLSSENRPSLREKSEYYSLKRLDPMLMITYFNDY